MPLLSIGTIIDRSWHHYVKNFPELVSASGWLLVLALLNIIATWFSPPVSYGLTLSSASGSEWFGIILSLLAIFIATPVLSVWISNTLIALIDKEDEGKPVRLSIIQRGAWTLFFPRLLVGLLTILVVCAPLLVLTAPGAVLLFSIRSSSDLAIPATFALFLGTMIASLLSLFLIVRFFFAPFAFVLDGKRGRVALMESARLVKGRWFAAFWRIVLPQIVFYMGMFVAQTLALYLVRSIILSVAGLNVELSIQLYAIAQGTLFILLTALFNPLVLTANTIVYKNFRETAS